MTIDLGDLLASGRVAEIDALLARAVRTYPDTAGQLAATLAAVGLLEVDSDGHFCAATYPATAEALQDRAREAAHYGR